MCTERHALPVITDGTAPTTNCAAFLNAVARALSAVGSANESSSLDVAARAFDSLGVDESDPCARLWQAWQRRRLCALARDSDHFTNAVRMLLRTLLIDHVRFVFVYSAAKHEQLAHNTRA